MYKVLPFLDLVWMQFHEVLHAYMRLLTDPFSLRRGLVRVHRDVFLVPIRSLVLHDYSSPDPLGTNLSQALALGEIAEIPGSLLLLNVFKLFGCNNYTAALLGGTIGDYVFSAIVFVISYLAFTKNHKNYPSRQALKQCFITIRNTLPVEIGMYLWEGAFQAMLLALGLGPNVATIGKYIFFMSILTATGRELSGDRITPPQDSLTEGNSAQ